MTLLRHIELLSWAELKRIWSIRWMAAAILVDVLAFLADNFGVLSDKLPAGKFYALGSALTAIAGVSRVIVQRRRHG